MYLITCLHILSMSSPLSMFQLLMFCLRFLLSFFNFWIQNFSANFLSLIFSSVLGSSCRSFQPSNLNLLIYSYKTCSNPSPWPSVFHHLVCKSCILLTCFSPVEVWACEVSAYICYFGCNAAHKASCDKRHYRFIGELRCVH